MDATRETIREIAAQIVTGQLAPLEGARLIAAEAAGVDDLDALEAFGDLAAEGSEDAILEQASLLLADTA